MKRPILYRKRLIPEECILLKDDELLYRDEKRSSPDGIPYGRKKTCTMVFPAIFLTKASKSASFIKADGSLICWYCDIVTHSYDKATDTYVFTDLLADVLVYPDGRVKVVDLDELSEANETGLLNLENLHKALRTTNALLTEIYAGRFEVFTAPINAYEHP
ncbi:MAG: DUF402 domain-containing protein [Blautia sp.]